MRTLVLLMMFLVREVTYYQAALLSHGVTRA